MTRARCRWEKEVDWIGHSRTLAFHVYVMAVAANFHAEAGKRLNSSRQHEAVASRERGGETWLFENYCWLFLNLEWALELAWLWVAVWLFLWICTSIGILLNHPWLWLFEIFKISADCFCVFGLDFGAGLIIYGCSGGLLLLCVKWHEYLV